MWPLQSISEFPLFHCTTCGATSFTINHTVNWHPVIWNAQISEEWNTRGVGVSLLHPAHAIVCCLMSIMFRIYNIFGQTVLKYRKCKKNTFSSHLYRLTLKSNAVFATFHHRLIHGTSRHVRIFWRVTSATWHVLLELVTITTPGYHMWYAQQTRQFNSFTELQGN